jgi:hypothetical protein
MSKKKTSIDPRIESGKSWVEAKVRELSRQRKIAAQVLTWQMISAPALDEGIALELSVRSGEALRSVPFFDVELQAVEHDVNVQRLLIERLLLFIGKND